MKHIAPPLGIKGFQAGCTQPGNHQPLMQTVSLDAVSITFTKDGPMFLTGDLVLKMQLQNAADAVGDTKTRISLRS